MEKSDITWLTREYLLVLCKRNLARCDLSRGRAAGFGLETQNKACEGCSRPRFAAFLPKHLGSCNKNQPGALTQAKSLNISLKQAFGETGG